MLANFFGKSKPVNFIIITLLFLGYYILNLFQQKVKVYDLAFFLESCGTVSLFLVVFFLYNFIIAKNKLTKDDSFAFLLFVMILGANPFSVFELKTLMVTVFLLFLFRKLYSLRTNKVILEKLFDAGFWLGVCFLLEPFSLVFYLMIVVAVLLFLEISLRTILIPVLGFVVPVFLFFTYCFFTDSLSIFEKLFEFNLSFNYQLYNTVFYRLIFGALLLFVIISILMKTSQIFAVSNKFKKSWSLLILHLLVSIAFVVLLEERNGNELLTVFIPASILIANWISSIEKKVIINIVLLLFFGLSLAVHFIA